ncbi:hypothetical protein Scep_019653 [Stephania cephalantha]|uniref:Uncharacterized protein n=2 Tax=Stephania TaxID=147243 RepID=A0AAP0NN52_9MAGN
MDHNKSTRETRRQSMFLRYAKAPVRLLTKARDLYEQRMTDLSAGMTGLGGGVMGGISATPIAVLPKSFSATKREEELRDLLKAASQRGVLKTSEYYSSERSKQPLMPRSLTVGIMGRIDEDKSCDFRCRMECHGYQE